jgi:hypothetical protein
LDFFLQQGILDIDKVRIDIMMLPGLHFPSVVENIVLIFVSESDSWFSANKKIDL